MFDLDLGETQQAVIKVVGLGGGGGNAVQHMVSAGGIEGVEFICCNTDNQVLSQSKADVILSLGKDITNGLGAGADPNIGRQAAEESHDMLREALGGADMVFITAGMGGGTGTGAAPVVAKIAQEMGMLVVAVVTKPFSFEGRKRMAVAEQGLKELRGCVDSLITIENNKLLSVLGKNITLIKAFEAANGVLYGAVQGISDLITRPGLINVDFADVRTVMSEMGMAMMGTGVSSGENRAREAADAALASPLLEDVDFSGARGVLVNITGGLDLSIGEFEAVGDVIKSFASESATVVVGTVIDPDMSDEIRVTVVVTGVGLNHDQTSQGSPAAKAIRSARIDSPVDYRQLDRPAYMRNQEQRAPSSSASFQHAGDSDDDYLSIPAFLRREEREDHG